MKKILCLAFILVFGLSAACFASPLTNYAPGQTAVDVTFGSPGLTPSDSSKLDGDFSTGFGITTGLGSNFALQYKYNNFKTDEPSIGNPALKAQEFNLLYKLTGGVSAFVGSSYANYNDNGNVNGMQFGLTGTTKIADKTNLYATLASGSKVYSGEIGVGYEIAKNTELTVGYRSAKYKGLTLDSGATGDVTVKGVTYGLGFKF
ncbi:MAG: outer membrane beta-barrel protein [Negativicutes bacterium]|nr:outer membrane beta-barrel protein [Negativicutes bacterium]